MTLLGRKSTILIHGSLSCNKANGIGVFNDIISNYIIDNEDKNSYNK